MSNEEITSSKFPKEDDERVLLESADISSSQSRMEGKDDVSLKTTDNSDSVEIPSPEFPGYLEDILHQEEITPRQSPVEGKDGVSLKSTDMSSSIEISSADFRNYLDDILQKETTPCQSPIEGTDNVSMKPAGGSSSKEISNTESRNHYGYILQKEITTFQSRMECKDGVSKISRDIPSTINISNHQPSNNLKDIFQKDDIAICQSSKECKDDANLKSSNISGSTGISNTGFGNHLEKTLQIEQITPCQSPMEGKDDVSLKSTDISSSIEISSTEFRNYLEDMLQNTEITPCQSPRKSNDNISVKSTNMSSSLENSSVKSSNHFENEPQNDEATKCQSQKESRDDLLAESVPLPCSKDFSTTQLNNYVQNLLQENSSDFLSSSTEGSFITSDFSEELLTEDSVSKLAGIQSILAREFHGKLKQNDIMHIEVTELTDRQHESGVNDLQQTSNGTVTWVGAREGQYGEEMFDSHCVMPNVLLPVSIIECQPVAGGPDSREVITRAVLANRSETEYISDIFYSQQAISNLPILDCTDRQRLAGDYDSQQSILGIQDQESMSEIQHVSEMSDSHHDRLNVIDVDDSNDRQRLAGISESQAALLVTQVMDGTSETDLASFMFDIHQALPMVLASNDVTDRQRLAGISDSQTAIHDTHIRDGTTDIRYIDKAIDSHFFTKDQPTLDKELRLQFSSTDDYFRNEDITSDSTDSEVFSMLLPVVHGTQDITAGISDSDKIMSQLPTSDIIGDRQHLTGIPVSEKDVRSVQALEIPSIDPILDNDSAKPVVPVHDHSSQGQNELHLDGKCSIIQEEADEHRIKGTVMGNILSSRTDEVDSKKAQIQDQTVQVLRTAEKECERKAERKFIPRLSTTNEKLNRKTEPIRSIVPMGLSMSAPVLVGGRAKLKTGVIDETDKMPRDGQVKETNVTAAEKKNEVTQAITERSPPQDEKTEEARNLKEVFDATGFSHFKAENLTDEQIQEFKVAFGTCDKDADGYITTTELRTIMRSFGMNPSKEDLKEIIQKLDVHGSGSIEFPAFLNLMARKIKINETEEEILSAFKVFDKDEDGYIDVTDFRNMMLSRGDEMKPEEVDEMIRDIDPQGTGRINGAEFARLVLGK